LKVIILECFERQLKEIFKQYPKSEETTRSEIRGLDKNFKPGNRFPGFGLLHVRKIRFPLKEYNLGVSKGLRIIFMLIEEKYTVVPLVIYKKGQMAGESDVINLVKTQLKAALAEL